MSSSVHKDVEGEERLAKAKELVKARVSFDQLQGIIHTQQAILRKEARAYAEKLDEEFTGLIETEANLPLPHQLKTAFTYLDLFDTLYGAAEVYAVRERVEERVKAIARKIAEEVKQ